MTYFNFLSEISIFNKFLLFADSAVKQQPTNHRSCSNWG